MWPIGADQKRSGSFTFLQLGTILPKKLFHKFNANSGRKEVESTGTSPPCYTCYPGANGTCINQEHRIVIPPIFAIPSIQRIILFCLRSVLQYIFINQGIRYYTYIRIHPKLFTKLNKIWKWYIWVRKSGFIKDICAKPFFRDIMVWQHNWRQLFKIPNHNRICVRETGCHIKGWYRSHRRLIKNDRIESPILDSVPQVCPC